MAGKNNYNRMTVEGSKKKSVFNCKDGIVKMLVRKGATHEEAQELFYESVADFYEKLDGEPDFIPKKDICSYLSGIALNKWREELRRRGKHPKEIPTEPTKIPEDKAENDSNEDIRINLMKKCLEELENINPIRYKVLTMHYYRGLSYKEIGTSLFIRKKKMEETKTEKDKEILITKAEDNARQNGRRGRKLVKDCIESKTEI